MIQFAPSLPIRVTPWLSPCCLPLSTLPRLCKYLCLAPAPGQSSGACRRRQCHKKGALGEGAMGAKEPGVPPTSHKMWESWRKPVGTSSPQQLEWGVRHHRGDLHLGADHHEHQGEYYCHCQAEVQIQQDGGHKGHHPDELQTEGSRSTGSSRVTGAEGPDPVPSILAVSPDPLDWPSRGRPRQ